MPLKTYKKIETIVLYFVIKKILKEATKTGPNIRLHSHQITEKKIIEQKTGNVTFFCQN